jgi:hypothetical protein
MTGKIIQHHLPVKRITHGPKHHFFGYFDKYPWDKRQKYLLAHETDFMNRQPESGDEAVICLIDLENNNRLSRLGKTSAWCWQQGAMLQWLNDSDSKIIYNDRESDHFAARILDIKSGSGRTICQPIYCLSPDGRYALSVNFSRLDKERPGYGYAGIPDKFAGIDHPSDDGIWLLDLKNNTDQLIISLDRLVKEFHLPSMDGVANWFNHLLFSPDSKRFAFFHRWRTSKLVNGKYYMGHTTRMFSADLDGRNIYPLNLDDMSSHYSWINRETIICFANRHGRGANYYEFTDSTGTDRIIGEPYFKGMDGHCSYSTDGKWMLTDSYPQPENDYMRSLYLLELASGACYEIGKFYADPQLPTPTRCDLHPNWSRDNRKVCIDSIHEGSRQIYILDVSELTKTPPGY